MERKLVLVKFIDGTSETIEAYYNPQDGYYGYLTKKELFYVSCASTFSQALFPREFVKAVSLLDE
jgi:hypothetical protein|nr:MAG TPA: hypothetical protein [Bacteriophage sp.]